MRVPPEEFEELVARALDSLPEEFGQLLDNVVVLIEDEPGPELLADLGMGPEDVLLGLYSGESLAEREMSQYGLMPSPPDRVTLYRGPLTRISSDRRELLREVRETVLHELGHHFGLGEDDMPY